MLYLGTIYGNNIPFAIKCAKHYRKTGKPFTAIEVNINRQALKKLSEKGVVKLVSGGKARDPNRYIVPQETIELIKRRFPDEL